MLLRLRNPLSCAVTGLSLSPGILTRMDVLAEVSRGDVGQGDPGVLISGGCQLNTEVPRGECSSEERPGSEGLEPCKVPEGHARAGRQKPLRNGLHSALPMAELSNRALQCQRLLGWRASKLVFHYPENLIP